MEGRMRRTISIFLVVILISFVFFAFIGQANAAKFSKTGVIKVPEGFIGLKFNSVFNVHSGKKGIPFYLWSWKIVTSNGSTVYQYWGGKPPKHLGPLSHLVLGPGTYYIHVDKGENQKINLKVNYDLIDNSSKRYIIPSGHYGYTVYDFDKEENLFFSGDCGYFKVKNSYRPYFFLKSPAYISLDDRKEAHYITTPDGYYIFDGRKGEPILFDKDDNVVIVDDGDGRIVIVEDDGL